MKKILFLLASFALISCTGNQEEINNLNKKVEAISSKNEKLQTEVSVIMKENSSLKAEVNKLIGDAGAAEQIKRLKSEVDDIMLENTELSEALEAEQEKTSDLNVKIDILQNKISELNKELQKEKAEKAKLLSEYETYKRTESELESDINNMSENIDSFKQTDIKNEVTNTSQDLKNKAQSAFDELDSN